MAAAGHFDVLPVEVAGWWLRRLHVDGGDWVMVVSQDTNGTLAVQTLSRLLIGVNVSACMTKFGNTVVCDAVKSRMQMHGSRQWCFWSMYNSTLSEISFRLYAVQEEIDRLKAHAENYIIPELRMADSLQTLNWAHLLTYMVGAGCKQKIQPGGSTISVSILLFLQS